MSKTMKAVIFANGVMDAWPRDLALPPKADLIICADGGLRHCLRFGLIPDLLVGDMDSVRDADLKKLEGFNVELIRHPARKNQTDLELALSLARERGVREIVILGALGKRWDMSLSHFLILAADCNRDLDISILEGTQLMRCLHGPGALQLRGLKGDRISLLPISPRVTGVTLKGLDYPLNQAGLEIGSTHGISNVFMGELASVRLDEGSLLIIKYTQDGPAVD